jgi:hypothetical protein
MNCSTACPAWCKLCKPELTQGGWGAAVECHKCAKGDKEVGARAGALLPSPPGLSAFQWHKGIALCQDPCPPLVAQCNCGPGMIWNPTAARCECPPGVVSAKGGTCNACAPGYENSAHDPKNRDGVPICNMCSTGYTGTLCASDKCDKCSAYSPNPQECPAECKPCAATSSRPDEVNCRACKAGDSTCNCGRTKRWDGSKCGEGPGLPAYTAALRPLGRIMLAARSTTYLLLHNQAGAHALDGLCDACSVQSGLFRGRLQREVLARVRPHSDCTDAGPIPPTQQQGRNQLRCMRPWVSVLACAGMWIGMDLARVRILRGVQDSLCTPLID